MKRINRKHVLSFPELKIDKEKLWLEFAPKIYFERKIRQLEVELEDLRSTAPSYSTNVKIAMTQGNLENHQKQLESILKEEKQRYRRMYKETIEQTEKRAKKGDNAAILRLIKWDKKWLFEDWVKSKILIAGAFGNREFLDKIAEALKDAKKRSPQHQLVLFLRELKSQGFNFANPKLIEDLRDFLLKRFQDMEVPESNSVFKPLLDGGYFNKFLKRHGIRKK